LPTNQIFHLSSEQTTFCADALLDKCGGSGTDDVYSIVVRVSHLLCDVAKPTFAVADTVDAELLVGEITA
jgi:hypothetical protein